MNKGLFTRIVNEAKPLCEEITMHLMGEPLAHPEFAELIGFCADNDVRINLTTNGTLLHKTQFEILTNPAIRQINFSLHSFWANQRQQTLDQYLNDIFRFVDFAMNERPDLYINFRLWNLDGTSSTDHQKNNQLLEKIEKHFALSINRNVDPSWKKSKRLINRLYAHFDSLFEWPNLLQNDIKLNGTCHGMRSHIGIHADGTVVPCCLDKEAVIALGNITQSPLQDIITSPRALAIKHGFEKHKRVEDLCQKCTFIDRFG